MHLNEDIPVGSQKDDKSVINSAGEEDDINVTQVGASAPNISTDRSCRSA